MKTMQQTKNNFLFITNLCSIDNTNGFIIDSLTIIVQGPL